MTSTTTVEHLADSDDDDAFCLSSGPSGCPRTCETRDSKVQKRYDAEACVD
jgi:hypothetical protein